MKVESSTRGADAVAGVSGATRKASGGGVSTSTDYGRPRGRSRTGSGTGIAEDDAKAQAAGLGESAGGAQSTVWPLTGSDDHESVGGTARKSEPATGLVADGPVGRAIYGLARVDRAMADILRSIADAGPVDGLPAARLISLAARATGWDIAYLRRMTDTLSAMPGVWRHLNRGDISWSQLRGICGAAKGLSVADRQELQAGSDPGPAS
ncbi:hypothetical protein BH24ACT15_BH24ACT15_38900 [soil metagenome]